MGNLIYVIFYKILQKNEIYLINFKLFQAGIDTTRAYRYPLSAARKSSEIPQEEDDGLEPSNTEETKYNNNKTLGKGILEISSYSQIHVNDNIFFILQ